MLAPKTDIDDDDYVPSGLLNSADNALERNTIKANEICEFYNVNKPSSSVEKLSRESNVFTDLSETTKPSAAPFATKSLLPLASKSSGSSVSTSKTPENPLPRYSSAPKVLRLQPGSNLPQLPSDAPKPPPVPTRPYIPRSVQMQPSIYRPLPMQMHMPTLYPYAGHHMFYPRVNQYQPTGLMPIKAPQPAIMSQQAVLNSSAGIYSQPYIAPTPSQMNQMAPMFHPMMLVPHSHPMMHQMNPYATIHSVPPQKPLERIMPPQEQKPKISQELRKRLREEASAKLRAEREARKAQLKAAKMAEKMKKAALKTKRIAERAETGPRKFGNFSKDMFVIRLKDVDSFNRNNEVWRIDNHVLIQKFRGVPSLRAPARQFQSTNRLSGYDSRATWRLFIIHPDNVEVEKDGSEVTIYDFPSIQVLREAKQLAEMKDGAFKEIEKSEYEEKLQKLEQKRNMRLQAKLKRRFERSQKKLNKTVTLKNYHSNIKKADAVRSCVWDDLDDFPGGSSNFNKSNADENVCREIINGMLDALSDDEYAEIESLTSSDEDSDFTDEGDEEEEVEEYEAEDAGSLISLAHSDNEDDIIYEEHELPAVGLELVID